MKSDKKVVMSFSGKIANGENKGKKFTYTEYKDGSFSYSEEK